MLDRSSLFNIALTACGKLRVRHPDNVTIKYIISQLHYLIDLDAGRTKDRSRLDTIVIGVLARREIEPLDIETAKLLEKVADEARKMEAATPEASPMFERKEPAQPAVTSTPRLAPADALDEAATPLPAPVPAAASPARSASPVAPAPPPMTASFLAGNLALVGTLSGAGDVHLGGPFEGEIGARDATVGPGGRVEDVITGRRIEAPGRVRGGLVADEVLARINAQVDGDVTSDSFALDAGARLEGRSVVETGGWPPLRIVCYGLRLSKWLPQWTTMLGGRKDGCVNPLKFAYLQCRMYHRIGLVLLLRMEGHDDIQARSIIDNHPSGLFRMTDDDLAFEQRKAQRLAEKKAHKPLKCA